MTGALVTPAAEPFSSLDAIRRANDELISNLPIDAINWKETERETAEERTAEFIMRVVETGAVLDMPADRKMAQGFINYWASRPYTSSFNDGATSPNLGRANTLLTPFDATIVLSIVESCDAIFLAKDPNDQAVMKRMLLHLLRVSDGGAVSSLPRVKTNLYSAGEARCGSEIIGELLTVGAIVTKVIEGRNFVELRYEALMRHWSRLRDWIDERIKFREAALFWIHTGHDKGALLGAKLANSAKQYGDLSDLEKEFIDKSLAHTSRRRVAQVAAALIILIAPLTTLLAYRELYLPWQTPTKIAVAKSHTKPIESRVDAIRWLAGTGRDNLDLSDTSLKVTNSRPIDLKGLVTRRHWNFKRAELANVDLRKSSLPAAQFTESAIADSHFDEATLEDANFSGARISDTSFPRSNLSRTVFDLAQLCRVDFSAADVDEASFTGIRYDNLPNFKNTAWWLASGWTHEQIDALTEQFGGSNSDIPSFRRELNHFEKLLEANKDPTTLEFVKAQDGIAWTYAIYGLDLDRAEAASRQSREGIAKLKGLSDFHTQKLQSYTEDTLGYILLQKGKIDESVALLQDAARFGQNPGAMFRYALALSKSGRNEEARKLLNTATANYAPSHELYLLRNTFSRELQTLLDDQQSKSELPPTGGWCH
ncbi:pentapeptide repeat-containing protein [Bradyrhizobium sp. USDA 4452]